MGQAAGGRVVGLSEVQFRALDACCVHQTSGTGYTGRTFRMRPSGGPELGRQEHQWHLNHETRCYHLVDPRVCPRLHHTQQRDPRCSRSPTPDGQVHRQVQGPRHRGWPTSTARPSTLQMVLRATTHPSMSSLYVYVGHLHFHKKHVLSL